MDKHCQNLPANERFWANVLKTESCREWQGKLNAYGYGLFTVSGREQKTHRYAFITEVGPIPDGMGVLHRCDNRKCVRPDHLFTGSQADNNHDAQGKDRNAKADGHGRRKLSSAEVLEIRALIADGCHTRRSIATRFGVSDGTIYLIKKGRTWRSI